MTNRRFLGFIDWSLLNVVLHGHALGDGHRQLDGFSRRQGMSATALHAQETAADIDLVLDDVAEERAFDDGAGEDIDAARRIGLSEDDGLRADRNRHVAGRAGSVVDPRLDDLPADLHPETIAVPDDD